MAVVAVQQQEQTYTQLLRYGVVAVLVAVLVVANMTLREQLQIQVVRVAQLVQQDPIALWVAEVGALCQAQGQIHQQHLTLAALRKLVTVVKVA